jgi:hypothetical protein
MSDEAPETEIEYEALPCSSIVYRAIRASWVDEDGQLLAVAFHRRLIPKDQKGLSVGIADQWDLEAFKQTLDRYKAVVSLHVGHVRDISGLDVVPDSPNHANITGIPITTKPHCKRNG